MNSGSIAGGGVALAHRLELPDVQASCSMPIQVCYAGVVALVRTSVSTPLPPGIEFGMHNAPSPLRGPHELARHELHGNFTSVAKNQNDQKVKSKLILTLGKSRVTF